MGANAGGQAPPRLSDAGFFCCTSRLGRMFENGPKTCAAAPANREQPQALLKQMQTVGLKSPPLVLCGLPGAGAGTIAEELIRRYPETFGLCCSHTTRPPRPGEESGSDYHFIMREAMELQIASHQFLEHAEIQGHLYGTSRMALQEVQDAGRVCVLEVDAQGARQLRAQLQPEPRLVLVAPPGSPQDLEGFDFAVVSDRVAESVDRLVGRLEAWGYELPQGAAQDLQ